MSRARAALIVLGAFVAIGVLVGVLAPPRPRPEQAWWMPATTFSAGPLGSRAFFLLLEREGFAVRQLLRAQYEKLPARTTLWILSPTPLAAVECRRLVNFVEGGGALVAPASTLAGILEEAKQGKPEVRRTQGPTKTAFELALATDGQAETLTGVGEPDDVYAQGPGGEPIVASWRLGEGRVVLLGWEEMVLNRQIGRAQNGPFLVRLARSLGNEHVFDEVKTGFGEANLWTLLIHSPYRWGLLQLALVCSIGLIAASLRRFPAEALPPFRRRSTRNHVEAVAGLWAKAQDPGLALDAIVQAADERARLRLREAVDRPFVEWVARVRPSLADRAAEAWSVSDRLRSASVRPSAMEARRAAAALRKVEEEALRW